MTPPLPGALYRHAETGRDFLVEYVHPGHVILHCRETFETLHLLLPGFLDDPGWRLVCPAPSEGAGTVNSDNPPPRNQLPRYPAVGVVRRPYGEWAVTVADRCVGMRLPNELRAQEVAAWLRTALPDLDVTED